MHKDVLSITPASRGIKLKRIMNIEVLLTEAEIAAEFAEALQARDLPEKFLHWFPLSVQRWRKMAAEPALAELRNTWAAVGGRAGQISSHFKSEVPVVSYGAGDGQKDRLLLQALRAAGKTVKYFPVDASQTLLEIACAAAEDEDFETVGIKADISSRAHALIAADSAEAPRLFLMAGNTLGGFDPLDLVKSVADCMRTGDRLIIDGALNSEDGFRTETSDPTRDFAFALLASIGIGPEDGRIRFEKKEDSRHRGLSMVTKRFHADRDLRISVSSEEVSVARGERIFLNFRYLYSPEAFRWLLEKQGGLTVEEQIISSDKSFTTAICSK